MSTAIVGGLDASRARSAAVVVVGLAAAGALGLLAGAAPMLAILVAVGITYLVTAYRSLALGLVFFTFLTFYATAASRLGGGVTVTKLGGILLAGLWFLVIFSRGNRVPLLFRDVRVFSTLLFAFMGWELATVIWAEDGSTAFSSAARLLQSLILIFVLYTAISERQHVRWLVAAFVWGSFLVAAIAILKGPGAGENDGRISGGFDDPNEFAAILVPAVILSCYMIVSSKRATRWLYLLALPLFLIAFRRADSQGGIMAMTAGALLSCFFAGPVRNRARIVTAVYLGVGIYYFTIRYSPAMLTEGGHSRSNLWHAAIAVWRDHKLAGVGAGNFSVVEPSYALGNVTFDRVDLIVKPEVAHNTYLHMAAETGAIGLGLMGLVIASALVVGTRAVRRFAADGDRELEILSRGILISTVAILVAYTFQSAQYEKQLWLLVGLCTALQSVAYGYEGRRVPRAEPGHPTARVTPRE